MENWGKYVGVVKVRIEPAGMFAEDLNRSVRVASVNTSAEERAVDSEEKGGAMKFGFRSALFEPMTWFAASRRSTLKETGPVSMLGFLTLKISSVTICALSSAPAGPRPTTTALAPARLQTAVTLRCA